MNAKFFRRALFLAALGLSSLSLPSCAYVADIPYYSHIVGGELSILAKRTPIQKILADKNTPEPLKAKLRLVNKMQNFAMGELGLPRSESYTTIVQVKGKFPRWVLAATPEFSCKPIEWCFPVYGCATSLPFFDEAYALKYQQKLRQKGYDVFLRGTPAYSTNGWFSDPVFDTFLSEPDHVIAGLIFHEKAHEKLSIKNDSSFNESFASFVQEIGETLWVERMHGKEFVPKLLEQRARTAEIDALLVKTSRTLNSLYQQKIPKEAMRSEKARIITHMKKEYEALKLEWGGFSGYDEWMNREWNNARFNQNNEYVDLVPVFRALYQECDQKLTCFYNKAAELAWLSPVKRAREIHKILSR